MLDQRIGAHRRAMDKIAEIGACCVYPGDTLRDALSDAARGVIGRGRHFPYFDAAAVVVEQAHIGEGASRIHADTPSHSVTPHRERGPPSCERPARTPVDAGGTRTRAASHYSQVN